jgi:hypothetical protein
MKAKHLKPRWLLPRQPGLSSTAPKDEDLLALRRAAWRYQGVVVLRPEDLRDDWTRQALVNEANRLYGWRPRGGR